MDLTRRRFLWMGTAVLAGGSVVAKTLASRSLGTPPEPPAPSSDFLSFQGFQHFPEHRITATEIREGETYGRGVGNQTGKSLTAMNLIATKMILDSYSQYPKNARWFHLKPENPPKGIINRIKLRRYLSRVERKIYKSMRS